MATNKRAKHKAAAADTRAPHAEEREQVIMKILDDRGFVAFRDLERDINASPATLRRDLERLEIEGRITRVHGGAKVPDDRPSTGAAPGLQGIPFSENIGRHASQKAAIGKAAAALCATGEGVIIDGGSTTLQMCAHLDGKHLQVMTNSLHIVSTLLAQAGTRVLVPGGAVFREQDIILSASGDDLMPRFYATKLFMGATAVGPQGIMQPDVVLVASERRLIDRAEQLILLVDSSKFQGPSGNIVCGLNEIDVVVTDSDIGAQHRKMLESAGVRIIVA
jgi:DeoR family ulaG and ulaABCDEF operon transcriptional repressor